MNNQDRIEHGAQPVAWLAEYQDREGNLKWYVTTNKDLAAENDMHGEPKPLYTHPATQRLDAQDAARWREVRRHIGAENQLGGARYVIRGLDAPVNVMRGSVAEHFTKSIDAAIAAQAKQGGAANG